MAERESNGTVLGILLAQGHQECPLSPQVHLPAQPELSNKPVGPGTNFHRNVHVLQSNNPRSGVP